MDIIVWKTPCFVKFGVGTIPLEVRSEIREMDALLSVEEAARRLGGL
jgi:hypothetical protein